MLSIGKIALGQHRYYEQQVAGGVDDYYSGRGEAPGEWVGAGAQALGLSGLLAGEQFTALVAGQDPRQPGVRLRSSERDPKVAALDLTFSAPKSVSVLAAVGPDELTRELVLAHEEALRAALGYLEETAVQVRRGHDGKLVQAGEGLIAAAYRHRMSRALDPQLHTHVVAANLARGPDGRFTALHGAPLYRAAKTAGYLYQSHMRALVSERLGLQWGPVHKGAAELEAVPEAVLAAFSRRRHEMQRAALAGGIGLESKAAAQAAALATRDRKRYGLDTHTWREEVRARAAELGLGAREIAALLKEAERTRHELTLPGGLQESVLGDRLAGAHGLTERRNTFDQRDVLQEFAAAAPDGAYVSELRGAAERFAARDDVMPTVGGEMTTAELVACERRLIAAAIGRAGEGCGVVGSSLIEHALATARRPLSAEQTKAVRNAVSSGHGVAVIEALAGTGKTYTAGVLREVYERAGHEVIGVAPTGRAARELIEQAGIAARTLDRLLLDLEQLGDQLPRRSVLIFDEAGMAPTRASARLLEAAEAAGAKVIAIGDPRQLSSVQAGGWLGAVGRALGALRLTEVMRQRDPAERRALQALHERRPRRYLQWAQRAGRIALAGDQPAACERAIEEWGKATPTAGVAQAVIIARDNDTRALLNRSARALQRSRGLLGEERSYGALELALGDRVICRRNDRLIDVDNGMRGTVRHLEADRALIDTDGGPLRELPAAYIAEHLEHAYALTGHGMQGATVEIAIVVASDQDLTAGWSYTALSRARGVTRLLIHDRPLRGEREEFSPADRTHSSTRHELLVRVQRRMLVHDEEDLAIEQLASAGRAHDRELSASHKYSREPQQEQAAIRADPDSARSSPSPPRLRALRERAEQLKAQLEALPTRELQRIEDLDAHLIALAAQCERLREQLGTLPEPRRRRARHHDPHALERAHLRGALEAGERQLHDALGARERLVRELGDPVEIRAERDGLERAIADVTEEHDQVRDELAERALEAGGPWGIDVLGSRPDQPRQREIWEAAMRAVVRYRVQYDVDGSSAALGPRPRQSEQRRDWQRAHVALERAGLRLGRESIGFPSPFEH